jgi:hypothetical protein
MQAFVNGYFVEELNISLLQNTTIIIFASG